MDFVIGSTPRLKLTFASNQGEFSVAEAAELVKDSRTTWRFDPGSTVGMIGQGEQGALTVLKDPNEDFQLENELRIIQSNYEGDQKELAAIFGSVLSAELACAEGLTEIKGAPALFAQITEAHSQTIKTEWSRADLEGKVASCLDQLAERQRFCRPEAAPIDCVKFWVCMAQNLWDEDIRRRLSRVHFNATTRRMLMMLAGSWMELRPKGYVYVNRSQFQLSGAARRLAWPQIMEWEAGAIRGNVLQYLTAYHKDYGFDGILINLMGLDASKRELIPSHIAAESSRALLEEAAMRWVVDPSGSFRVDLPRYTPLQAWGVTSMRVWIIPQEGIWVALEKDEQPGASLRWSIHPPHLRRWILHENVVPALHLTLSALWRDLKIGGREAILADEDKVRNPDKGKVSKLRLYGRIQWGSEEELERILREAYPVDDHIRVLPPGKRSSRRASRRALAQGIILKPGTTYVRKHKRGKPEDTEKNVPYKAQGLAKLILASRKRNRVQKPFRTR